MQEPEDLVWNTITESAKTQIDYQKFAKTFQCFENENTAENILFLIIIGFAAKHSIEEIMTDINNNLALFGMKFDETELANSLGDMQTKLKNEIHAAGIAMALFEQGYKPPGILVQVKSLLKLF